MQFKERLKRLILERGCTQLALANFLGVKPNTVSDWINKGTSPKVEHIYRIAEFFNVSFDYIFTGESEKVSVKSSSSEYSNDELELISYFRKLPNREKYMELCRIQNIAERYNT
ncbi:MAG: helix-turn-helix domain-containing protein [Ruminococcus sp.]|nr:helix-turn-helix domain-containing protein [Ruminococcus sp.]